MDGAEDTPVCVLCSRRQATCCQKTEILLTRADIGRIARATGRDDFYERRPPTDPEQLPDPAEDALWAGAFAADGSRAILRHAANGDCGFLRRDGCALDMETRPFVCRLYPYEYDAATLKGVSAHHCPPELRDNPALALARLAMSREDAERWRKALYAALAEE